MVQFPSVCNSCVPCERVGERLQWCARGHLEGRGGRRNGWKGEGRSGPHGLRVARMRVNALPRKDVRMRRMSLTSASKLTGCPLASAGRTRWSPVKLGTRGRGGRKAQASGEIRDWTNAAEKQR